MNNLGKLKKHSSGCGEQNMINFAPDVFVALYLRLVTPRQMRDKQQNAETEKKAWKNIRDGYINQLR